MNSHLRTAFSFFVECHSEEEISRFYEALEAGGVAPMALANYGFSRKFAWITDRFEVSWQLNLAQVLAAAVIDTGFARRVCLLGCFGCGAGRI